MALAPITTPLKVPVVAETVVNELAPAVVIEPAVNATDVEIAPVVLITPAPESVCETGSAAPAAKVTRPDALIVVALIAVALIVVLVIAARVEAPTALKVPLSVVFPTTAKVEPTFKVEPIEPAPEAVIDEAFTVARVEVPVALSVPEIVTFPLVGM